MSATSNVNTVTLTASSNLMALEANITTLVSPYMSNDYFSGMEMGVVDINATNSVTSCNIIMAENMAGMLGVYLTSNCPITHSALANYLHEGEGGAIDYSWIHYPFSIQTTMNDLFQLASEGYELYSALTRPVQSAQPFHHYRPSGRNEPGPDRCHPGRIERSWRQQLFQPKTDRQLEQHHVTSHNK